MGQGRTKDFVVQYIIDTPWPTSPSTLASVGVPLLLVYELWVLYSIEDIPA